MKTLIDRLSNLAHLAACFDRAIRVGTGGSAARSTCRAVALGAAMLLAPVHAQNLVQNAGAESGAVGPTGYEVFFVPDWVSSGNFTAVAYGVSDGFPTQDEPGGPSRGMNFFAGGPSNPSSKATQTIDAFAQATAIDAGRATYALSGYLGGYSTQEDHAQLVATFLDLSGIGLGTASIGPVTAADRGGVTGLLFRSVSGSFPAGTRQIELTLQMTRVAGDYNDGYADDLVLTIDASCATPLAVDLGNPCGASLQVSTPGQGTISTVTLSGRPLSRAIVGLSGHIHAPAVNFRGCTVLVDFRNVLVSGMTDQNGSLSRDLLVPTRLSLCGKQYLLQGAVINDSGAVLETDGSAPPRYRGLAFSNGVLVTIGN